MKRGSTGEYVVSAPAGGEQYRSFVPYPLPPDPPLHIDQNLQDLTDKALLALGRLDAISSLLPEPTLFLYMYVRKEAVLSSQIEGTQSSLSDLLLFESAGAPGVPLEDVQEVSNATSRSWRGGSRAWPVSAPVTSAASARSWLR